MSGSQGTCGSQLPFQDNSLAKQALLVSFNGPVNSPSSESLVFAVASDVHASWPRHVLGEVHIMTLQVQSHEQLRSSVKFTLQSQGNLLVDTSNQGRAWNSRFIAKAKSWLRF
jgi:hypothetical protein